MSIARYSLVNRLPLTVYRPGTVVRDPNTNRIIDNGTETNFEIKGNYWPLGLQEVQFLPEALRTKAEYKLSTTSDLQAYLEGVDQKPDEVEIDGFRYEVHGKKPYKMRIRDHYEYTLIRKTISAGGTS